MVSISIRKQVAARLSAALVAAALLAVIAASWLYGQAADKAETQILAAARQHVASRVQSIEEDWEAEAASEQSLLQFLNLLADRTNREARFQSYFTTRSATHHFRDAIVTDATGAIVMRAGHNAAKMPAGMTLKADTGWVFEPDEGVLYRVYRQRVLVGPAGGYLYLIRPADNALLFRNSYPGTDICLVWDGQVVASSKGGRGLFGPEADATLNAAAQGGPAVFEWTHSGGQSPALVIHSAANNLFTFPELLLPSMLLLACVMALSWLLLGTWLRQMVQRVMALRLASRLFATTGAITPDVTAMFDQAGSRQGDEIDNLATGLHGLMEDVSRANADLKLSASVFHNTIEGIVITDTDGIIVSVNPAFTEITGWNAEEVLGKTPRLLKSDHHEAEFYAAMWRQIKETGTWQGEVWNRRKNGEIFLEWQTISMVRDEIGQPLRYVAVFNDITEARLKDERIRHMAYHDALTGLANRQLLQDRVEHTLAIAQREDFLVAVMFLDLDRFKVINDSLGHDVGDSLLREVAVRLQSCVRRTDTVARMGGDEFVVLLDNPGGSADVAHVASKIVEAITLPMILGHHTLHVTTSLGIGLYPQDGADAGTLMKNADTAMYAAKQSGRNAFRFFDAAMNARAAERLGLESALRRAIDKRELELFYQPKIRLADGMPCGAEALVRWRDPEYGLISPADFIPLAEETGLIVPMGEQILEMACATIAEWRDGGINPGRIAINLSGKQFRDANLALRIQAMLAANKLPPAAIEVELTESTVMADPEQATRILQQLRDMGIEIAVDDFGTGYSSLSYLSRLPISTLKIDRSFVDGIAERGDDAEIVRSIIGLANSLRLSTVAEGVEEPVQAEMLESWGCGIVQGYLYSRPLDRHSFVKWLAERRQTVPT